MIYWKIQLTPKTPYFFGNERSQAYQDNRTQKGLLNPYYIPSNEMPAQSALFGVLRYLGIHHPTPQFDLTAEDKARIGGQSFDLYNPKENFGMIKQISPLMIYDQTNHRRCLPAPGIVSAAVHMEKQNQYTSVQTLDGERWLPDSYDSKDSRFGRFLCPEDHTLIEAPFHKIVRVGIGRRAQDYFKREYVILGDENDPKRVFSFLFYAATEDSFRPSQEKIVFLGRRKAPFSVQMTRTEEPLTEKELLPVPMAEGIKKALPSEVIVDGKKRAACYGHVCSDMLYEGDVAELRRSCCLLMGTTRDYRVFTTNYQARRFIGSDHPGDRGRYIKREEVLRLLPAGTVLVFRDRAQQEACKKLLSRSPRFQHGEIAGFNCILYT